MSACAATKLPADLDVANLDEPYAVSARRKLDVNQPPKCLGRNSQNYAKGITGLARSFQGPKPRTALLGASIRRAICQPPLVEMNQKLVELAVRDPRLGAMVTDLPDWHTAGSDDDDGAEYSRHRRSVVTDKQEVAGVAAADPKPESEVHVSRN